MSREWSIADDQRLRDLWPLYSKRDIARMMGKTKGQIAGRSMRLNLAHEATGEAEVIEPDHPAALEGRTVYRASVEPDAADAFQLLKPGRDSRKLGARVTKGPWRGMPIYSLTLEERATCPSTCALWLSCYGNSMPFARRHGHGPALEARLADEIAELMRINPGGVVIRLHVLGDFYSTGYVGFWTRMMVLHPALRVFGYTARDGDDPIGRAVLQLRQAFWPRFMIRQSGTSVGKLRAVTLRAGENPRDRVIICPAETKQGVSCSSCGLCWSPNAQDKTIGFVLHGAMRTRKARPVTDDTPKKIDPGPRPELGWLPISDLHVPDTYQRTLDSRASQSLIAKISVDFDWRKFQAVTVVPRDDEGWWIVDGQHRTEGAKRIGETHVPCVVIQSAKLADQAMIFVAANKDRVAVSQYALYYASIVAEDPAALVVARVLEKAGLSIPRRTVPVKDLRPGQILSLSTVQKAVAVYGEERATLALAALSHAWREKPKWLRGSVVKAVCEVVGQAKGDPAAAAAGIEAKLKAAEPKKLFIDAARFRIQNNYREHEAIRIMLTRSQIKPIEVPEPVITVTVKPRKDGEANPTEQPSGRVPQPVRRPDKATAPAIAAPGPAPLPRGPKPGSPRVSGDPYESPARNEAGRLLELPSAVLTPALMTDAQRFAKAVRTGGDIKNIAAAFGISVQEAKRRADALQRH